MRFSLHQLQRFCPEMPTEEKKLRAVLDDAGLEVKKVEKIQGDQWITLEILANRGDHYSYLGVAKEIAARIKSQISLPTHFNPKRFLSYMLKPSKKSHQRQPNSSHLCPLPTNFFSLFRSLPPSFNSLSSLNTPGSPQVKIATPLCLAYTLLDMKLERDDKTKRPIKSLSYDSQMTLQASGILSGNSLVDISNLVNYELGQPLHFFDKKKIKGMIKVRETREGEKAWLLFEKKKRELPSGTLVISDREKILAVAGVIGCEDSKVDKSTQALLIEAGAFDPVSVRKTSQALALQTDASNRFQRGSDADLLLIGLDWALSYIDSLNEIQSLKACFYYRSSEVRESKKKRITLDLEDLKDFFGEKISKEEVTQALQAYDFTSFIDQKENSKDRVLHFTVPLSRSWDVKNDIDLYEEVARYRDYNSFPETLPQAQFGILASPAQKRVHQVNQFLVGAGYFEVFTDHFYSREMFKKLSVPKNSSLFDHVETTNAIDRSYSLLKNNCLLHALEAIYQNSRFKNNHIKMFEWTKTYHPSQSSQNGVCDEKSLLWACAGGQENPLAWDGLKREIDIFYFKGLLEELSYLLKIDLNFVSPSSPEIKKDSYKDTSFFFHPYRHVFLYSRQKKVGILGEIHPDLLQSFSIKNLTPYYFEIKKEVLFTSNEEDDIEFPPKIPDIQRDFSLYIPSSVSLQNIQSLIKKTSPSWLKSFRIKEKYTPKETPSLPVYTYELNLDGETERSLKDINGLLEEVIQKIEAQFGKEGVKLKGQILKN